MLNRLILILPLCLFAISVQAQTVVVGNSPFDHEAGGGDPGWVPGDLADLELFLDGAGTLYSDTGCTTSTTSGVVRCYPDASANSRDALDSGGTEPTYTPFGGGAGVTLADNDYLLFDTDDVAMTTFTVVIAVNLSADNDARILSSANNPGGLLLPDFSTLRMVWTSGATSISITTISTSTDYVLSVTYDGADVTARANGTQIGTIGVVSKTLALGRVGVSGGGGRAVPGDYGTILIYSDAYVGSDLQDAECYVASNHSITISGC